jgi:NADH-quinone oxidoreductase subunit E
MKTDIEQIIRKYTGQSRDHLIPLLQDIQDELGYISEDSVVMAGRLLGLPASKIYGVATFYNQFRFNAPGKYHIQVCRGTACHVLGSNTVLQEIEKLLKIKSGQTTPDKKFSIEVVACIGACGLAPVIAINGEFYAKVSLSSIKSIIETYKNRED